MGFRLVLVLSVLLLGACATNVAHLCDTTTGAISGALPRDVQTERLESMPCCTTTADGAGSGDPLDFALVGDAEDMMAALSESGWSFTHRIDWPTIRREIRAALSGGRFSTARVSSLYASGRSQDLAFQRARSTLSQRNHMRLWMAPYKVEGTSVWIGQVSRDIGIKLTRKSPTLTTRVIDPTVEKDVRNSGWAITPHGPAESQRTGSEAKSTN